MDTAGFKTIYRTHPEWARMWNRLFNIAGSYEDFSPDSWQCWQYMGTFRVDWRVIGPPDSVCVLVHQFRHRDRPLTAKPIAALDRSYGRVYVSLAASWEFSGHSNFWLPEGALVHSICRP